MRTALASAASMMTASSGSRPQMNDTTQSSHAEVAYIVQSSQLMVIALPSMGDSFRASPMMTRGCDIYSG